MTGLKKKRQKKKKEKKKRPVCFVLQIQEKQTLLKATLEKQ